MSTDQDTRPGPGTAPVVPLPQPTAPPSTRAQMSGLGQVDALSPRDVLALASGQVDELAARIEKALVFERAHHDAQRAVIDEQLRVLEALHERRTAVLGQLADELGELNVKLDEIADRVAGLAGNAGAPATVFGFADGDRVRDPRSGCTGRVRIHALSATERAEGRSEADVVWDGFETVVDLEFAVAHGLERQLERPR